MHPRLAVTRLKFTSALDTLSTGEWIGPINSALGSHIVYISKRIPAGYFPFNEVEDRVNIDYNYKASIDFKKEFITSLLKNYTLNLKLEDKELKMELNEKF